MFNRRRFLTAGTAMLAASAAGLPAFATDSYTVPDEHMPVKLRIDKTIPAGEIHVDPNRYYLYHSLGDGWGVRYVVGVAKRTLYEGGTFTVGRKVEWPSWRPTASMIERNPSYAKYADGMPGGPNNPLGARALYLYNDAGYDTALRIHGTPDPWTVQQSISNGCVRLINSHVVHLYDQVQMGAKVVLYPMAKTA